MTIVFMVDPPSTSFRLIKSGQEWSRVVKCEHFKAKHEMSPQSWKSLSVEIHVSAKLRVSHLILLDFQQNQNSATAVYAVCLKSFPLKLIAMKVKFQVCSPVESLPAEFQAAAKTLTSWGALLQGRTAAAGRCKCSWKDFCLEPKNIRLSLQFSGCRAVPRGFPNAWACSHLLQIRPAACQVEISPPSKAKLKT